MKKLLFDKYDKKRINELPRVMFPGRIVTVLSASEAERAVGYLLTQDILGIDTETRPSFRRGVLHQVALLQVSTRDICFLFRLNVIGVPPSLIRLLEDEQVLKVGLSLNDDITMLHHRVDFNPGRFVDLQNLVGDLGIKDQSLQKLYANVFGERIAKREQLSNWENDVLTDKQKMYAATDAWTCIRLYEELMRLKETGDYTLEVVPEPVQEETNQTEEP